MSPPPPALEDWIRAALARVILRDLGEEVANPHFPAVLAELGLPAMKVA